VARSELYPTLTAAALAQATRSDVLVGGAFVREQVRSAALALDLTYMIFDFGGRAGRIASARADTLAANLAFNDTHRKIIFQVSDAYYRLLNASGQEEGARASLDNAQTVQRAAEERLRNGLATMPDVLEARSAAAQADYELQATVGAREISRGDLAMALGAMRVIEREVRRQCVRTRARDSPGAPAEVEDHVGQVQRERRAPDLLAGEPAANQNVGAGRLRERRGRERRIQLAPSHTQCRRLRARLFPGDARLGIVALRQIDQLGE